MASKTSYVYKTVDSLSILLDIYTRETDLSSKGYNVDTPVVLFFHGGGMVSHDRRLLPPHIPQSCLLRGWPLVSADYRLFPQAHGLEILEDVMDSYAFVREKLPGILNIGRGPMKNVIVAGSSAGMLLFSLRKLELLKGPRRVSCLSGWPPRPTSTTSTTPLLRTRLFG